MALPSSGQIDMNQMNTDRGIPSGTQIDLASAGTAYSVSYNTSGTDQLGMDEFYGKSIAAPPPPVPPTPPPAVPTYSIAGSPTVVNEGNSVTFTITTTNVPNGTVLYWTTDAPTGEELNTPSAGDFTDGVTQGSITINSNSATLVRTLVEDSATEGDETFVIKLRDGSTSGAVLAISNIIIIGDTSLSPPPPPPPAQTCFLVSVTAGKDTNTVCCGIPTYESVYFNASSVASATVYYGDSNTCSSPWSFTRYFLENGTVYRWQSGVMTNLGSCPTCN